MTIPEAVMRRAEENVSATFSGTAQERFNVLNIEER